MKRPVCQSINRCNQCGIIVNLTKRIHVCGTYYCSVCKSLMKKEKGYKVKKIHEIWNYKQRTQYDKKTGTKGHKKKSTEENGGSKVSETN